jgi:hypothetical protein
MGDAPMVLYWIQDVARYRGHGGPSLSVIGFVIVGAIAGVLLYKLADVGALAIRRRVLVRRRERADAGAERRARALMGELCQDGWRAQITLFAAGDEPPGAPPGDRARVALDWAELGPERGAPAIVRRIWAPTVAAALEAMVADRRTDETLEQIEQRAIAEDAQWPDG